MSQKKSKDPARMQLILSSWADWEGQLTAPRVDRTPIAKRLKELIRQDKGLDTERNRVLLKFLDLALVPSKAKPGSTEALVDAPVDFTGYANDPEGFQVEDCYWRVASLGFDAVPAMIEHLDEDRLTRGMMQGFNNFFPRYMRVGDVAGDLLEGLAGHDIDRDWVRRLQGHTVEKAKASQWWEKARKVGEER
jgi:hypothetical protein